MPETQLSRTVGVVGEQEILDRVLRRSFLAMAMGSGRRVDTLGVLSLAVAPVGFGELDHGHSHNDQ